MEDVSELRLRLELAEEAVRKAEERAAAGRLALEVMHDIRNPLEALRNLNYLTSLSAENPADVRRFVQLAEEQLEIVTGIANSTLGFVKAAKHPRPVNLAMLAEAGLRIHQRTIERKKIHLSTDFDRDAVAPMYPGELLQVISNLLTNALDAVPSQGALRLRVRKCAGCVYLVVADSGHGISPENLHRIFKPFFTTKDERGTGLGLALSRKIVERHHGSIRLRTSQQPGKSGTVFRISLPI
jgi:signal transduction histidine kinase